jgi:hypothetical protein
MAEKTQAELSAAGARMVAGIGGESELQRLQRVAVAPGNGKQAAVGTSSHRQPMIASLRALQDRSNGNWDGLVEALGTFVTEQRALLDTVERWLGTK